MREAAGQPQVEPTILISNLSLPLGVQMLSSLQRTAEYLHDIGVEGLEVTPSKRGRFMGALHERIQAFGAQNSPHYHDISIHDRNIADRLTNFDRSKDWSGFDKTMTGILRSLHSSPRDATDDKFDPLGCIMFPHFEDSLRTMSDIQRIIGRKLPAVVFPRFGERDMWYDERGAPFEEVRFQPYPADWLLCFGLTEDAEIAEIKQTMDERGLHAVVWPTLHAQNPQKLSPHLRALQKGKEAEHQTHLAFKDPLALASRLAAAGLVPSVHVEIDRRDCTEKNSEMARRTRQARVAFADPESSDAASKTLEGEMLAEIARHWKVRELPTTIYPTVVVEMLPPAFSVSARREQAAIVRNIRSIIAAA